MRTTLTLEDDIAARIKRLRRQSDASLKDIINEALRRGLDDLNRGSNRKERFNTQSVDLGRLRLPSLDNISESLAAAEGEAFK
jgi:ribbon-helix-helix CopG family protein